MPASRHDEWLASLPADWEQVPISELGDLVSGGTPKRSEPSFWGGDIAWVTPSEITELRSKWLYDTREHITAAGLAGSGARLLPTGSLLVTTRATVGAIAIAARPVATNQGFKSIIANGTADMHFYFHLFQLIAPELKRLASGSTFDEISRRDFGKVVVPRPKIAEQRVIAEILDTADETIALNERLVSKLRLEKLGLAQDLLGGQVRAAEAASESGTGDVAHEQVEA